MSHHHYEDVIDPETGKTYAQTKDEKKMKEKEEKKDESLEPKPMTDQEKEDILSMDEVMTYFLIDECGAFLFRMAHDMADGKIPEDAHETITTDLVNIRQLQKFTVDNLHRFDVDPESAYNKEDGDYWKWLNHWGDWKNNLTEEEWGKVSIGEYEEYLPKHKWNEESSPEKE